MVISEDVIQRKKSLSSFIKKKKKRANYSSFSAIHKFLDLTEASAKSLLPTAHKTRVLSMRELRGESTDEPTGVRLAAASAPSRHCRFSAHDGAALRRAASKSINAVEEAIGRGNRELSSRRKKKRRRMTPVPRTSIRSAPWGQIMQHIKRPDGTVKVLVEGRSAYSHRSLSSQWSPSSSWKWKTLWSTWSPRREQEALQRTVQESVRHYARFVQASLQPDVLTSVQKH